MNKEAGVPVHPSQGHRDNTLANAAAWYFKQKGEPFVYRAVSRLDRDTSLSLIHIFPRPRGHGLRRNPPSRRFR